MRPSLSQTHRRHGGKFLAANLRHPLPSIWAYRFGIGLGGEAFPVFLLSGILGIGVGDVALFQTLPRLGSRLSLLMIQCLTTPFAALLEWCWLGTTLSHRQVLCGLTVLAGVGIALMPGEHLKRSRRELIVGTIWSLVAALGGARGAVLTRKAYGIAHGSQQPIDGGNAAFQRIVGGLFVGGICLLIVKRRALRIQARAPHNLGNEASKNKWRAVWPGCSLTAWRGRPSESVACNGLETTPTGIVLAIIATSPIVVIPFAVVMEGERPTVQSIIGGMVAVAGVIGLALSW